MADSVSEAQERYQECLDALRDQRRQIEEDLDFSDPSDPQQWDPKEKHARENDPGGGRPCLVHDQTSQYVQNVAGQVEQRPPAIHALPVDSGGDKKVAEHLDGFFRHIEHASRAHQHYARALMSAARTGVGYLIVRPDVVDPALNYQEPRISSEGDPLRVVLDPWSQELDGSDADCGWLLTPMSHRAFERAFGKKAEKVSFGEEERNSANDDRESIVVAEQWIVEQATRTMVVYLDANGNEAALKEDEFKAAYQAGTLGAVDGLRTVKDKYRCVKWCRLSGAEVLVEEREFPASGIGIVPVYGYVGWAGGRMTYCGIPRRARAPQQAYNYHVSEIRAIQAAAAKAPYLMPISGLSAGNIKDLWDKAATETRAYLPYQDWDDTNNRPIAPPTRNQFSVNLTNHEAGAAQALRDIQSSIGMYQANLGAPSNETSGVAIESRKQQGEASTANFPANLAAALTQVGRLLLDMIPRTFDVRRQMRVLGIDATPSQVMVNPQQPKPVMDMPQGGVSINPNIGRYDARVVVGASFSTQRTQTVQALNEVMARNPAMAPAIAPMWAGALDIPDGQKLQQALIAIAPPPIQAIFSPQGQEESAGQLKAALQQMQQRLQEAAQIAQEAQQEADQAHKALQAKEAEGEAKEDEIAIKQYDAYTKRLDMLIKALGPQAAPMVAMAALPETTPPIVRQMLAQTVAAASAQPVPSEEGAEPMDEGTGRRNAEAEAAEGMETPEEADPMGALGQVAAEAGAQIEQNHAQVMQGLTHVAAAMGRLAKLMQAPRTRTPERGPDGSITRVVDEIDPAALAEMQAEGPMQ